MILVAGGAGYVGSHCVLALTEKGYETAVLDNLSTGHIETVKTLQSLANVPFFNVDLLNVEQLEKVFSENKIEAVIHFAAFSLVGESVKEPKKYYVNNVIGSINLLNTMLKSGVDKIVFSSSAATYGEPKYVPIDEKHSQMPINPYGQSKLALEKIMDDYSHAYGLRSVRLRYFNVIGADRQSRVGEWHTNETHLVPNILKASFGGDKVFEMFGDDYDTKDGTCVRDYIDVEDLAQAHILALEYLKNGGKTDYFNLGTNTGSTVKEIFDVCKSVTGKDINVKVCPRREGDPAKLVADNSKAKEVLHWQPSTTLKGSILKAYEWEKVLQQRL